MGGRERGKGAGERVIGLMTVGNPRRVEAWGLEQREIPFTH